MTLPATGIISLGNTTGDTTTQSVNKELGFASPYQQAIGLGDAAVRTLFGVATGAIGLSGGYGKSSHTFVLYGPYTTVGLTNVTMPAGVTSVQYILVGGGGGGGVAPYSFPAGGAGGGGGGGQAVSGNLTITAGQVLNVTIGAAGASAGTGGISTLGINSGAVSVTTAGGIGGVSQPATGGNGGASGSGNAGGAGSSVTSGGGGGQAGAGSAGAAGAGATLSITGATGTWGAGGAGIAVPSSTGFTLGVAATGNGNGGTGGGHGPGSSITRVGGVGSGGICYFYG